MKCLDFVWQTNEFMVYCRSTQLREYAMLSYEQALHLFFSWLVVANISLCLPVVLQKL